MRDELHAEDVLGVLLSFGEVLRSLFSTVGSYIIGLTIIGLILIGRASFSFIAFAGVVMASYYALRLFIRAMHNRVGRDVTSRDMSLRDGFVLVPLVVLIIAFALYPQIALFKGQRAVTRTIAPAQAAAAAANARATEQARVTP